MAKEAIAQIIQHTNAGDAERNFGPKSRNMARLNTRAIARRTVDVVQPRPVDFKRESNTETSSVFEA
jgi:hypothetical protein